MAISIPQGGHIAVLGGGIIGISTAIELIRAGFAVTIIDRAEPQESAAANNAGQLCFSHIDPMIDTNALSNLPFLLLRSSGPLFISKSSITSCAAWFKSALVSSSPTNVVKTMAALSQLNSIAKDALVTQFAEAGISDAFRQTGVVYGYTEKETWRKAAELWEKKTKFGIKWSMVSPKDLPDYAPALHREIESAVYVIEDGYVSDPGTVVVSLYNHAASLGAGLERRSVTKVGPGQDGLVRVTLDAGEARDYHGCVVAMGVWSGAFARGVGDKVMLTSQRGYNQTFPDPKVTSTYPVILEDQGLAITQLDSGLRVGGWVEFDDSEKPPSDKIHKKLGKKAKDLMPKLGTAGAVHWMGNRPSTPDSIPVIGPSPKVNNLIYAFGHGHLGLTQSAATGCCVAALAAGQNPPVQLAAFGIERFA